MKKFLLFLMPIMLVSLTGCDFVRAIAGRPTEKDLDKMRIEIVEAEKAALQARMDSLKLAEEKAVADSLAFQARLDSLGVVFSGPERLRGVSGPGLEYRYYIIVGVFRESSNARRIFNQASEKGYAPVLINSRSGMMAVGLAPADNRKAIVGTYEKLRNEAFCPKDAWILVNE